MRLLVADAASFRGRQFKQRMPCIYVPKNCFKDCPLLRLSVQEADLRKVLRVYSTVRPLPLSNSSHDQVIGTRAGKAVNKEMASSI